MQKLDREKLIQEVREKGVEISSINDLMKINMKYRDLVPILLKHLNEVTDENDKEFIVRCLGVKGFIEASKPLISEFYKSNNVTFKWAIGNSLSIISDIESLPELIKIAQEKEHGIARQMIVDGLGAYKSDDIKAVLVSLLNDDEVVGHVISGISKTGDKSLIKHIEPLLTHKVKWVRNEASKAIKKLEKA
ncbi:MAG TPA: HEAT repeat domain-containing protein [Ruminiclostridium sp.]|nr:HEAT repeat domain-containing protein [Ruminiclostridium sp.]